VVAGGGALVSDQLAGVLPCFLSVCLLLQVISWVFWTDWF